MEPRPVLSMGGANVTMKRRGARSWQRCAKSFSIRSAISGDRGGRARSARPTTPPVYRVRQTSASSRPRVARSPARIRAHERRSSRVNQIASSACTAWRSASARPPSVNALTTAANRAPPRPVTSVAACRTAWHDSRTVEQDGDSPLPPVHRGRGSCSWARHQEIPRHPAEIGLWHRKGEDHESAGHESSPFRSSGTRGCRACGSARRASPDGSFRHSGETARPALSDRTP